MVELIANSLFVVIGLVIIILLGMLAMLSKWYHKAKMGQALVRNGIGGHQVSFSGIIVVPVLHQIEILDTTIKHLVFTKTGPDALITRDNVRVDIKITFSVGVNQDHLDVLKVAQSVGCENTFSMEALIPLFEGEFMEKLGITVRETDYSILYSNQDALTAKLRETIKHLNGFVLHDVVINSLHRSALE